MFFTFETEFISTGSIFLSWKIEMYLFSHEMKYLSLTHGGICLKGCAVFIDGANYFGGYYVFLLY
jgi:hypothetical protein